MIKRAKEIAQWVIDNRHPKSENEKVSDAEMYNEILRLITSYEQDLPMYLRCGQQLEGKM
jgi:phosphoglycerol transferase MdoB-like AlkP superfamily enzyme